MGFFLAHTWPWWLLAIVLGLLITWLIFRDWKKRGKHAHDEADLKAQNERLQSELDAKNKDCDKHTGDLTRAQSRIIDLETDAKDHAALKARNAELEGTAGDLAAAHTRISDLELQAEDHSLLKEEHASLKDAHASLQGEHASLADEHESLKARNAELEGKAGDLDAAHSKIAELELAAGGTAALVGTHEALKDDHAALKDEHESLKARNAELEGTADQHASDLADARRNIEGLQAETANHAMLRGRNAELETEVGKIPVLRSRIAELEPLAIEHPGLKARNSELEGTADELAVQRQECEQHTSDLTNAHARIAELEAQNTAAPAVAASSETAAASATTETPASAAVPPQAGPAETPAEKPAETSAEEASQADVSGAQDVLGYKIKADDLTEIEGIGPKIRDLLHAQDIRTWRTLSQTDTKRLEEILQQGGPRFQMHNPGSWPRQAGYLADGDWEAHKRMTATLRGGRERV